MTDCYFGFGKKYEKKSNVELVLCCLDVHIAIKPLLRSPGYRIPPVINIRDFIEDSDADKYQSLRIDINQPMFLN